MSFRSRQTPGRSALLTLAFTLFIAATASAGLRDIRVAGEAPVRSWAARNAPAVDVVRSGGFLTLEGSVQAPWYRVRTTAGKYGWVAGTLSEGLLSADEGLASKPTEFSGSLRLLTPTGLRGGPVGGRPVQHELAAGTIVRVLDQYGTWVHLGDTQGRSGWAEASTFVAAVVQAPAATTREPDVQVADEQGGVAPTGAELRELRLEERRAEREAEAAASESAAETRQAKKEARRLENERRKAEREAEAAESEAGLEAKRASAAEAQRLQDEERRREEDQRKAQATASAAQREADAEARRVKKEARRLELEERKAQEEAERAEAAARRQAEEAERTAAKAERATKEAAAARAEADAAPLTEKEIRAAERRAAREAKEAEREAERAAREAAAAEKLAAREAAEAEKQAAREAAAAEKQAAREAAAAEKQARAEAAATEKRAEPEAVEASEVSEGLDAAEIKSRERAAAAARKDERRAAEAAEKRAAREAKDAEKLAKKRDKQQGRAEPERPSAPAVMVQQVPDGPVAPADIPPSLGVTLGKKAPAEKKADPARSPLASETLAAPKPSALPVLDPIVERSEPQDTAAAELLEGFKPYDEKAQVGRSVEAVHDDREEALGLSFAERPSARSSATYVNEAGDMVDTKIVSEIVLRVGSEILTLGEFDRRVDETQERESLRAGETLGLDQARQMVMRDLVNDLVLIHQGRALGIRFDVVYESAKEDFKKSGGISDDLELLRLLDEMGMTFKDFRREMIRRTVPGLVIRTQVMSDVTVPDDEIDNYYRRHQDEWQQEDCVLLRELVLQPEARETTRDFNLRLEEILKRVEAGEDFCDLARRHSRSPSAAQCGSLDDCFSFEQLDEKVARVVFKMRPGDVEPIRTDWGYHLLRLEEHRPRRVRTLEQVRDGIVRQLQREKLQGEIPRYIEELRRTVRIEVSPAFQRYWDDLNARGGLGQ